MYTGQIRFIQETINFSVAVGFALDIRWAFKKKGGAIANTVNHARSQDKDKNKES